MITSLARLSKSTIYFVVTLLCFNSCSKKTDQEPSKSSANLITSFSFDKLDPVVVGTVDQTNSVVNLTVPSGTDITGLVPAITLSNKATVSPSVGSAVNFTNAVNYTVTAENGSQRTYKITVIKDKSSANFITSFKFADLDPVVNATIDASTKMITAIIPHTADIKKLTPTISISDKATITPATLVSTDFSKEVNFTVTAENGSTQVYKVNITQEAAPVTLLTTIINKIQNDLGFNTPVLTMEYDGKRLVKAVGRAYYRMASSSPFIQTHVFNYDGAGKLISTDISYQDPTDYNGSKYQQAVRSVISYTGDNITNIKVYNAGSLLASEYTFTYNNGKLTKINDLNYVVGADNNVTPNNNDIKVSFDNKNSLASTLPYWQYFYTQFLLNSKADHPAQRSGIINGIFDLLPSANNLLEVGTKAGIKYYNYGYQYNADGYPLSSTIDYNLKTENYSYEYKVVK